MMPSVILPSISHLLIATFSLSSTIPHVHADNEIAVLRAFHQAYPEWKPRGVVDVGANKGGWTTNIQQLFPNVTTMMVEASPFNTQHLEETKTKFGGAVDYRIALLSSTDGDTVEFFDNPRTNTGNSMFQENSHHFVNVKPQRRTTSKLDTLVSSMPHIDYLKLDVQGAELMVLSGATETLKRTTCVQLEVSIIEYNKGGACWYEIESLLRQHGFFLYDMGDLTRNEVAFHTKAVGQLDVLYIRPSSDFMPQWLVDNKVQFCGSSREAMAIRGGQDDVAAVDSMCAERPQSRLMLVGLVTFLAGYFVGRKKDRSMGMKKN
ncbi:hypothetical protein HJC23_012362 [Cyclotella cryptica]|uniref:Methyltransferase FkbM domain-containing protein n=1 Tax=Cyclotella cryptica TaxID=29204 RepID=A0ABD3QE25_9STRA|eukprot:CCRYP_006578-RA/>CCRYP_006578-RA protein AED:0.38 eAED:0.38 QI:0/-1/0/1/-1/1/1/0/319